MKSLYVVDRKDINDTTISDSKRQEGWLLDEVTELINSFADEEYGYRYELDKGSLGLTIVDPEALAERLINNGINDYGYGEYTNKYGYVVIKDRRGNPHEIKLLVEDIILDFLADSIANLTSYKDIPAGVQISYYE